MPFSRRADSPSADDAGSEGFQVLRKFRVNLESPVSGHLRSFLRLRDELMRPDRAVDLVGRMVLVECDQHPDVALLSPEACSVVRRALFLETPEVWLGLHVYSATSARAILACEPRILRCTLDAPAGRQRASAASTTLKIFFDGALLHRTCELLFARARFALERRLRQLPPRPGQHDDLQAAIQMQSVCLDHLCRVYVAGLVEAAAGGDPLGCEAWRSSPSQDGSDDLAAAVRAHVTHLTGMIPA